jgi:hypothetical protein
VKDHDAASPDVIACASCATLCDPEDSFCRNCGSLLAEQRLPVVRSQSLPEIWRPRVRSAAVKSAAFVAAGTIAEIVVRRAIRRALGRVNGTPEARAAVAAENGVAAKGDYLTDTILVRQTRIRR